MKSQRERPERPRWIRPLAVAIGFCLCAGAAGAETARLAGNVLSVDADAGSLTILDAGRQHVLTVSPETTIRAAGSDRALSDLHRGDRVVITLADDDATRAARISVAGSALPPKGRKSLGHPQAGAPGYATGLNAQSQLHP